MRLFAVFLVLTTQFNVYFASPPNPLWLSSQTEQILEDYECGNVLFSFEKVKETLSIALNSIDKGFSYPEKYQGKLYSESVNEDYFLYPMRNGPLFFPQKKHIRTVFFIVFKRNDKKEVDVVARIVTGDYTKCIRRHRTHSGLSHSVSVPENANGYQCGNTFFTDETIKQSLLYAHNKADGKTDFPSPYVGTLYPKDGGYLMWPIMRRNVLYISGKVDIGPYFLILNNQRQVVGVVVKGFSNNFLRCLRIRKPPTAPESDPLSKLFVQPPRSGYMCGKFFFNDNVLQENAKIIKHKAAKGIRSNLPEEYFGPPFNERCLIWPILEGGRLFKFGHKGSFRLILTPEYKVRSVAMLIKDTLKPCERITIVAKKNHDTSAYQCINHVFSHQELVIAAEDACMKMGTVTSSIFPARCEETGFKSGGPYFSHPIFRAGISEKFKSHTGLSRVMINTNCEVVGALTMFPSRDNKGHQKSKRKKLMRCHRMDDGLLPAEFFGANARIVYEYNDRIKQMKPLQLKR